MAPRKPAASAASVTTALNLALLASIVTATQANSFVYVSDADNAAFLSHNPPLVLTNPTIARDSEGKIATKASDAGIAMIAAQASFGGTAGTAAGADTGAGTAAGAPAATNGGGKSGFSIVMAAALPEKPESKRGGGVGAAKYPFDSLPAPASPTGPFPSFFVPATEKQPEPHKSLVSTVNGALRRFGTQTGTKTVTRAKRGEGRGAKALLGADGKPVMETVEVPVYKYDRKLEIREIADGAAWGFAGQKGAAVYRTA